MRFAIPALMLFGACKAPPGGDSVPAGGPPPECVQNADCKNNQYCAPWGECEQGDGDSFDDPKKIKLDNTKEGVIDPPGDVDWYQLTTDEPMWVRLWTTTTANNRSTNLDTIVRVFTPEGLAHSIDNDYATGILSGYDTRTYVYLPQAGRWRISVEDISTWDLEGFDSYRGDKDFEYTLGVEEWSTWAPNDGDGQGNPFVDFDIASDSTTYPAGIVLDSDSDEDWIGLQIDAQLVGRPLEIWGQSEIPGSSAQPVVRLYDSVGQLALEKPGLAGAEGFASLVAATDSTYELEAADLRGTGDENAWFVVYITTYAVQEDHPVLPGPAVVPTLEEPNDDLATASVVESEVINLGNALYTETWFNGRLDTDDDEDWVHLVVNPDEMISVRCYDQDLGSQADLRVEVLTSTGEDITPWGQGSTAIPDGDYYLWDADSTAGGDFYLRILRESGPSGPSAYYRCLATAADFSFQ